MPISHRSGPVIDLESQSGHPKEPIECVISTESSAGDGFYWKQRAGRRSSQEINKVFPKPSAHDDDNEYVSKSSIAGGGGGGGGGGSSTYFRQRNGSIQNLHENKVFPRPIDPSSELNNRNDQDNLLVELLANESQVAVTKLQQKSMGQSGKTNSFWQLLSPFNDRNDMYDMFLNFKNTDVQSEENWVHFISFKRSDGSFSLQLFVLLLIGMFIATLFWFNDDVTKFEKNPLSLVSFILAVVTVFLLISTLLLRLSLLSFTHNISFFRYLQPITLRFYDSFYGQCLDDGAIVCGTLTSGIFLISQVMSKHRNWITSDVIIFAFIVIIVFQMTYRGVGRVGLVCAWIIMIVCINVSLGLVGTRNSDYVCLNGELFLLVILTYEIERQTMCQFIMSVRILEVSEMQSKTAIHLAEENARKRLVAKKCAEALASTAKLLAASRETEKIAAYSAEKALTTTVKLLSVENDNVKLIAVAEAKAASTSAVLLAAANDLNNKKAMDTAKKLVNTGMSFYSYSSLLITHH